MFVNETLYFSSHCMCLDKESQSPNILSASFYGGNLSEDILGTQILLVGSAEQ